MYQGIACSSFSRSSPHAFDEQESLPSSFWHQLGLGVDLANSHLDSALCALNSPDESPMVAQGRGVSAAAAAAAAGDNVVSSRRYGGCVDSPRPHQQHHHQLAASGCIAQASPSPSPLLASIPSWSSSTATIQDSTEYNLLQLQSDQQYFGPAMEGVPDNAPHGMAAQQEAAKEYRPDIQGPDVGPKTPSSDISEEYAKADPVYVEKTIAISQTYSSYRPIKGDGNCGWRAIGFSYFEKLAGLGDSTKLESEVARLTSMNTMLGSVGGYTFYEDWADEAIGMLRELVPIIADPVAALALVEERWNDTATSSALIYYLRLLAATYLKANAAAYDPFVPDGSGVQSYCANTIEPVDREIDQLGIIGLANVLVKPVDLVLEIAYLDRTPGSAPNMYRFPDDDQAAAHHETIHLLFRPDHYDILYRDLPPLLLLLPPQVPFSSNQDLAVQVNHMMMTATPAMPAPHSLRTFATADFHLATVPGLLSMADMDDSCCAFADGSSGGGQDWTYGTMATTKTTDKKKKKKDEVRPMSCNIRFSALQLDYEDCQNELPDPMFNVTTATFKNSIWNRAHYGNPDFHPEEWNPTDDGGGGPHARFGPRRRPRPSLM